MKDEVKKILYIINILSKKKKKKNFVFKSKEVFRLIHKKLSVFQLYKNGSFTYFDWI